MKAIVTIAKEALTLNMDWAEEFLGEFPVGETVGVWPEGEVVGGGLVDVGLVDGEVEGVVVGVVVGVGVEVGVDTTGVELLGDDTIGSPTEGEVPFRKQVMP